MPSRSHSRDAEASADGAASGTGSLLPSRSANTSNSNFAAAPAPLDPNQVAGPDGVAAVDQRLAGLKIGGGGEFDVIGRGVIVHANADDYTTQPTGNAGGRIACGVIESGPEATTDAAPTP